MEQGSIVYTGETKKGKTILIRYIQQGDAEQMTEYINTLSQEKTFIRFQGEKVTLEEEQRYLDDQLKRLEMKKTVHLLVICNDKLIGISGIDMCDRIEKHVGVFGISLAKDFRGEGIGKLLVETVLKEAEKNIPELELVTLGVFANNPLAISLYEKLGFVQFGSLPKGVMHKGEYVDHHYMYKSIR